MSSKSIVTAKLVAINITRIGATAISKLSVSIEGKTTAINESVWLIAPNPIAIPPKHPTAVKMTNISPNRLNSAVLMR